MPLKEGSSDRVIQENIKSILRHDGSAGYTPPYKDKSRDKYTPEQAAAIAYAKAGQRKPKSKKKDAPEAKKREKHEEKENLETMTRDQLKERAGTRRNLSKKELIAKINSKKKTSDNSEPEVAVPEGWNLAEKDPHWDEYSEKEEGGGAPEGWKVKRDKKSHLEGQHDKQGDDDEE